MRSVNRSSWLAAWALAAVLGGGLLLAGCSDTSPPGPTQSAGPAAEPEPKPTEPPVVDATPLPQPEPKTGPGATPLPSASPELGTGGSDPNANVSTYAPVADLVPQVPKYIAELETSLASETDYKVYAEKIAKDSNTLILIALALGMHDQDSPYKASAGAMMRAAQELAATKDFASAKKALAAIQQAASGPAATNAAPLKWDRVASLPETMKKVPLINTSLKGALRVDRRAKDAQGECAVLAVIGQGSMANVADTQKPDMVQEWYTHCLRMRNAAAVLSATVATRDQEAIAAKMTDLQASCDECHAVFCPEQLEASKAAAALAK